MRSSTSGFLSISFLLMGQSPGIAQSYGIQTIAGTTVIKDGVQASTAFLRLPFGVAADAAGNVYIADQSDNRVRKIGRDGVISTVAGTGVAGHQNDAGPGNLAQLDTPFALALDKNNNLQ